MIQHDSDGDELGEDPARYGDGASYADRHATQMLACAMIAVLVAVLLAVIATVIFR